MPDVELVQLTPTTIAALAAGDLDAANATSPVPLVRTGEQWDDEDGLEIIDELVV